MRSNVRKQMKILRNIQQIYRDLVGSVIIGMPGPTGRKMRYWYYKKKFKKCGRNVVIDEGVIIQNPEWISVGDNVWIDRYCVLIAGKRDWNGKTVKKKAIKGFENMEGELIIGDNVHIAPLCVIQAHGGVFIGNDLGIAAGTKIYSLSHHHCNPKDVNESKVYKFSPMTPNTEQSYLLSPIVIEDNAAVGLNSVLLLGAHIMKNSWVSVNSVVIGRIPENCIAAGNPAKKIKDRFRGDDTCKLG